MKADSLIGVSGPARCRAAGWRKALLGKVLSELLSVPQQGIDKFLNGGGGYGFIKSDSGGRDIFVN